MEYKKFSTEALGDTAVLNEQGEPVKLSYLWGKKTAVLVFVRHFG